jgi:phosphonate transport system permease protein
MTDPSLRLETDRPVNIAPPAPVRTRITWNRAMWLALLAVLVWAYFGTEISLPRLVGGLGESWKLLVGEADRPNSGFFPPDFRRFPEYLAQMLLTIKMAMWGTLFAVILAVPLSILAARNTSPHPVVYVVTRRVLDFLRGLNEFVLALIFVVAVGLGPFPGILALALHTAGILAKLFSEGIETVDTGQIEAVQATGASPFQVFTHGVWPQVVPHVVSMTLYRFESNVRAATVLGIVGAGGIGFYITEAIRGFDFRAASAIILLILVSVFLVDSLSAAVRQRLT